MPLTLNLSKKLFSPTLFPLLFDYSHRFEFYKGSAGSGKSYFITQKLIIRACQEPIKILVCRRYGTTIRNTCFALFKEIIHKWNLDGYVKIRESDFNITFPHNGSQIIFTGLDEETKLLSLTNISCIFVEEVYEITQDILEQLSLRMRGQAKNQQIIAAFNPISSHHWLYNFCVLNPPQSFIFSETTYKDNPFLSKEYVDELEEMVTRNPAKARIYVFGEWGVPIEGLVFTNWKAEEFDIAEVAQKCQRRAGLDFGFKDPAAIVDSFYDAASRTIYVVADWYKTGQTLEAYILALDQMELKKCKVFSDAASPTDIATLRDRGYNLVPCSKGKGSVEAGIRFLQDQTIIVHPNCKDVIRELENFSYIKDKQTGVYTEKMTHEFSHSIDALRYAYSDIYMGTGITVLDKKLLGL